ncbi:MAG: hypothetical protein PHF35_05085 [Candidatus Moranbacteria bacterium]|nr:hypothetical protein [Candidatus Moranbacteria bacterium]
MSINNFIHKLQQKPVRERERIAVAVTIVGFFIFAGIWVLSLREMGQSADQNADQGAASLEDLKNNLETGKDSIQNMMQNVPSGTGATNSENVYNTSSDLNSLNMDVSNPSMSEESDLMNSLPDSSNMPSGNGQRTTNDEQ